MIRTPCSSMMCPPGFHHIRVHAPGATESATVRRDFTCPLCSSPLIEDVKFRVLGGEWSLPGPSLTTTRCSAQLRPLMITEDVCKLDLLNNTVKGSFWHQQVVCAFVCLCVCVCVCVVTSLKQTSSWWSWFMSELSLCWVFIHTAPSDTSLSACFSEVSSHLWFANTIITLTFKL